jgi:DNA polymerase III epsilon subunit-like protein
MQLVFDIETSGFDPIRNDIVSMCALVIDDNLNILGEFYELVAPEFNEFYSQDAEKIHGLSRRLLSRQQNPIAFLDKLLLFLKSYAGQGKYLSIFHALRRFDLNFLLLYGLKHNRLYELREFILDDYYASTIEMARKAGYRQNKLSEWAHRIGFDLDHHDARSDTHCALHVYKFLKSQSTVI